VNADIIRDAEPAQNFFCSVLQSTMSNYLVRYHPANIQRQKHGHIDEKVCRQKEGKSKGRKINRKNWSKWHRRWAGVKNNTINSGRIRARQ